MSMNTDFPARAIIDRSALGKNLQELRKCNPNIQVMAVVKANAYGHGGAQIARAALEFGVKWFGVAQLAEALQLRQALKDFPAARIFTWIFSPDADLETAIKANLDIAVSNAETLLRVASAARAAGKKARVHLAVDTGMGREGALPKNLAPLLSAAEMAADEGTVEVSGIWSHLARGDENGVGEQATVKQLADFQMACEAAERRGFTGLVRHLSASSGLLWHPPAHFDLARYGIAMYGLTPNPSRATTASLQLTPIMRLEADLISVKKLPAGHPVSYGGTWVAPHDTYIGIVPLGYADGIDRHASGKIWVAANGERYPQVGRICMDQFMVDLGCGKDGNPPLPVGATVRLWGDGSQGEPTADDWAKAAETINYTIVTDLNPRVPRVYI
ncbi:alanine racemase [Varibaculum vaginae]|uniref:alanine racemase n=1 Tax=Varibaculum vaginae TaxID=2364797 RepID=UPI000F075345|nr:alanine racemase [Varibaculum vaginae]